MFQFGYQAAVGKENVSPDIFLTKIRISKLQEKFFTKQHYNILKSQFYKYLLWQK